MRLVVASFIILTSFFLSRFSFDKEITAQQITQEEILKAPQPIKTESRFHTKLESQIETIPRPISFKDDPDMELGEEKTTEEGADGKSTKVVKITFYEGREYSREVVSTETENPKEKIILRGNKIIWKNLDTSEGQIKYWRKIRVWATHYDWRCPGCNQWTATGLRAGKGVIAVDPKVIKLGTGVYVPGYGQAIAGDTGGVIKGNIIDLGFDDAKTSGWVAKFVDVYLLN